MRAIRERQQMGKTLDRSKLSSNLDSLKEFYARPKLFAKTMWVTQGKQLIRLFNLDLKAMVNGMIKINELYDVDFSFIDKVLTNMVGIQKQDLLQALLISDNNFYVSDKQARNSTNSLNQNNFSSLQRSNNKRDGQNDNKDIELIQKQQYSIDDKD